jgi:hypothetical protein
MNTLRLGIAVATLALMSAPVSAQVGVRIGGFGIGLGVPTQPLFRERPGTVERYRAPQRTERVQRRRHNDDDEDVKSAKKTSPAEDPKAENENSSIVSIAADKDRPGKAVPGGFTSENSSIVSITGDKERPVEPDAAVSNSENSTIASVNLTASADPVKGQLTRTTATDSTGKPVAICKRYFPTVGQTISVPCE